MSETRPIGFHEDPRADTPLRRARQPLIPDEAVEAAHRAWREQAAQDGSIFEYNLRAALEAAAPHMLAEAWKEGEAAGQDNAYAYQVGIAVKSNPYRPADAL